jgi:hypothetical protein
VHHSTPFSAPGWLEGMKGDECVKFEKLTRAARNNQNAWATNADFVLFMVRVGAMTPSYLNYCHF